VATEAAECRDKEYVTSLKLGRKVYGVVTDVVMNDSRAEYEFETWFDKLSGSRRISTSTEREVPHLQQRQ